MIRPDYKEFLRLSRNATLVHATLVHATPAHAISERAPQFYEHCGFLPSPMDPMTLMITVAEAVKALLNRDSTSHRP
jgi:hypothetical protein